MKPQGHEPAPSQTLEKLWIGDRFDAVQFKENGGEILCVLEEWNILPPDLRPSGARWMPIIASFNPNSPNSVKKERLEEIAAEINKLSNQGTPLMVYCNSGSERSPLVTTWYIHRYHGKDVDKAFEFVKSKRMCAQNRLSWVSP